VHCVLEFLLQTARQAHLCTKEIWMMPMDRKIPYWIEEYLTDPENIPNHCSSPTPFKELSQLVTLDPIGKLNRRIHDLY